MLGIFYLVCGFAVLVYLAKRSYRKQIEPIEQGIEQLSSGLMEKQYRFEASKPQRHLDVIGAFRSAMPRKHFKRALKPALIMFGLCLLFFALAYILFGLLETVAVFLFCVGFLLLGLITILAFIVGFLTLIAPIKNTVDEVNDHIIYLDGVRASLALAEKKTEATLKLKELIAKKLSAYDANLANFSASVASMKQAMEERSYLTFVNSMEDVFNVLNQNKQLALETASLIQKYQNAVADSEQHNFPVLADTYSLLEGIPEEDFKLFGNLLESASKDIEFAQIVQQKQTQMSIKDVQVSVLDLSKDIENVEATIRSTGREIVTANKDVERSIDELSGQLWRQWLFS